MSAALLSRRGLTVLTLLAVWIQAAAGFQWKSNCFGPSFDSEGSTVGLSLIRLTSYLCSTDVQTMWDARGLGLHSFPYLHGSFTPPSTLGHGSVEYPVLSGVFMWLSGLLVSNDLGFLAVTTLLMAVASSLIGLILIDLVGKWALIWALAPALTLYTSYNWDMLPALCVVGAVWVSARGQKINLGPRTRDSVAAVFLALGCLFKLYPGLLLLPLALYALTRRENRFDWIAATRVCATGLSVIILVNAPFALLGQRGWLASFQFQGYRAISNDTLSIWYWGLSPFFGEALQSNKALTSVTIMSLIATLAGCALAVWLGWRRFKLGENFPALAVGGGMIIAYMVLNKVDSLQYTIWVVPFLALLSLPVWKSTVYFAIDAALFYVWFTNIYWAALGAPSSMLAILLSLLIWTRVAMLVVLFVSFIGAYPRFTARPKLTTPRPPFDRREA